MRVRVAELTDAAEIAAVHVASWQRAYSRLLPQSYLVSLSVRDRTDTWRQSLSEGHSRGVRTQVAELHGRVIGFASTGPSRDDDAGPRTGELWAMYLHPDHWGAGHGHDLYTQAMSRWQPTSPAALTEATLWVLASNVRARRFYEAHGWVDDDTTKTVWRGEVRLDEVRYRVPMSSAVTGH